MNTQNSTILKYLQRGGTLTALQALHLCNCLRLGSRIWELRQAGHQIKSQMVKRGRKYVAEYSI